MKLKISIAIYFSLYISGEIGDKQPIKRCIHENIKKIDYYEKYQYPICGDYLDRNNDGISNYYVDVNFSKRRQGFLVRLKNYLEKLFTT
jgi:hypothetical protein